MIDLTQFCSADPRRPTIVKPWSRGQYTYATNGHVMVRVPRRTNVPEIAQAPNAEKIFEQIADRATRRMANIALPPLTKTECDICNGRGTEHDCPHCECDCETCDGTGEINSDKAVSVALRGANFAGEYVRLIQALPNLEIAVRAQEPNPMPFKFDGGDGVIMPIRGERPTHIQEAA